MDQIPYAIAAAAGMLAVLNPCGFALLPGYLALLTASGAGGSAALPPQDAAARLRALGRALAITAAMTGGFVAVFGGAGLVAAPLASTLHRYLPWATVVIGVLLAGLGAWLLAGRRLGLLVPLPSPGRPDRTLRWAAGYGTVYALASLSCTIGPFFAVTASALQLGGAAAAFGAFLAYAAGMGLVIGVLTVAAALANEGLAVRLRRALPYATRAGGALVALAGAYVAYYGWVELRVAAGGSAEDPVVGAATAAQSALARGLDALGPAPLAAVLVLLLALGTGGAVLRSRRKRSAAAAGGRG
ncbi:cytochrome c biogenesis CcdA family protein [Streptomonospora litoralis]|uniref:Cytochrome C biogenesis protein transmembrane region n=1 Tax=Streptomonospora litoralis TaxID=2498135 RepID=A0A4P6Q6B4_9ACTN|nr:cytochrome c biogenesis protein CcdA [Streptomonospora litoralis]QBI54444.1 Cytochrome C biogenesis protein transmembrane region [Streptomonospora litoralis]